MNYESKNLRNYSNKIFRFQRVSGIHTCLFCFGCGIFVHRSCPSPTRAGWDGAAFPLFWQPGVPVLPASSSDSSNSSLLHSGTNSDPPPCSALILTLLLVFFSPLCPLQVWPWHIPHLPRLCRQKTN